LQLRAVRWEPDACTAGLITASATATLTPTQSATTTRSPSPSTSPASVCNIRTVVGTGTSSSTGDGGQGTSATISHPFGVTVNGSWLYVTESNGMRVRRQSLETGLIGSVLGSGAATGSFLGVAATSANVGTVTHVTVLPSGDIAANSFSRCAVVGVATATQLTYAIAGTGTCLVAGDAAGSGVAANSTAFGGVRGSALWLGNGLFVSSFGDHRVRLVNLTTGACV
jgi:large repetitive protein